LKETKFMSFQSVWGFDPDEVIRSQELKRRESNVDEPEDEPADQPPPGMPLDVEAQIYELRRMFGIVGQSGILSWRMPTEE
jgi:hypothetical protein